MFFGYPIAATVDNWLHECLVEMVSTIHHDLAVGAPARPWPDIIPAADRDDLMSRHGLRDRLEMYRAAVAALTEGQRQQIETCLGQQNRISELCCCAEECESLDQLPEPCRTPISELFGFAFNLLSGFGIRDRHYASIYNETLSHICPFCGYECFDAPGAPREDLDHYLPRSRYPFAGANLRNLVPMGMKCNERYKLAQDILRDVNGTRRRAFDPYADRKIVICLDDSVPFAGDDGYTPRWYIGFDPDGEECTTWDAVFNIRLRISRDVLNPSFKSWLRGFSAWIKSTGEAATDDVSIIEAIERYAGYQHELGYDDRAFLRAAVFGMIHHHCTAGNTRLVDLMRDLVTMGGAA